MSSKKNSKTKDIKIVKGDKPITPIRIYIKEDKNNTLDLSAVSQGVYFVKISANNQSIVKRIIKN